MLAEMERTLIRLDTLGLAASRAASDLRQLHKKYLPVLNRVGGCTDYPHVMRILVEEAVEDLCIRLELLGIPIMDESPEKIPLYWKSYLEAVTSGEIAGLEYTRFQKAKELAAPFWEDSYEKTVSLQGNDYKTLDYAYALSDLPLPEWFTPLQVLRTLEEIVTAFGFLWFSVVDYAESSYYEQKGA